MDNGEKWVLRVLTGIYLGIGVLALNWHGPSGALGWFSTAAACAYIQMRYK